MRRRASRDIRGTARHPALAALVIGPAAALALAACGVGSSSNASSPHSLSATASQAPFEPPGCPTYSRRGCAQPSRRVDVAKPSFSNPTRITNPLFPISRLHSAVLLGRVSGKPFRTETTLLPATGTVTWSGRRIRVALSQYMAYLDGRLQEVALDRYAQADDGSVWYLGEDVFDYRRGAVSVTEGTWLAGKEGPPAMIMPAKPEVGDSYRLENVPGVVFEEVTIKSAGKTVQTARGPVSGAITGAELHLDGTYDQKMFAPGYGEFRTTGGGDVEAMALAVPTDALPGPPPAQLTSMSINAEGILESARVRDWPAVLSTLERLQTDWKALQPDRQPRMIAGRMSVSLAALARAVKARRPAMIEQSAIDAGQSALDLSLRHRAPVEVNAGRFHLWTQQLRVDAAAKNLAGVTGDVAVLEWIRDRLAAGLDRAGRAEIDSRLRELRLATDARNLPAAADHAARLAARARVLAPSGPAG